MTSLLPWKSNKKSTRIRQKKRKFHKLPIQEGSKEQKKKAIERDDSFALYSFCNEHPELIKEHKKQLIQ